MRASLPLAPPDSAALTQRGLLLRGVLSTAALPAPLREALRSLDPTWLDYPQLIVFGHAGPLLWRALRVAVPDLAATSDPVDAFSLDAVRAHLEGELGVTRWTALYPGSQPVPLQELGALLGWHHPSPLRVGINATFGTWFAYRAAVVADSRLPLTELPTEPAASPCASCVEKPCLGACLGGALTTGTLALDRCVSFRALADSPCARRCPAREACPVAPAQRYDDEQIRYHYDVSLRMIRGGAR